MYWTNDTVRSVYEFGTVRSIIVRFLFVPFKYSTLSVFLLILKDKT